MVEPWWSAVSRATTVTAEPVLQVAADGRWETAEAVPVSGDPSAARGVVERVARAAGTDVAVEILWPAQAFVGVQWPAASWRQAAAGAARGCVSHATIEAALLALLGGPPGPALEVVELGAVNAWHSIGPERLWRRGDAPTEQTAESVLARRPDLATCPHPLAVEFGVTKPQPCWVGINVPAGTAARRGLDLLRGLDHNG